MEKIDQNTIRKYARRYFSSTRKHLASLRSLQHRIGEHSFVRKRIEEFMFVSGLSAADMMFEFFSEDMLNNDEFRAVVMLYACVCIITSEEQISMIRFREYMTYMQKSKNYDNANDLIKYFTEIFDIDPGVVPKYVQVGIAEMFEERNANRVCNSQYDKIDSPDEYMSFDGYREYMENHAKSIINILNIGGHVKTHDLKTFTYLLILKKLNFPVGNLYSSQGHLPVPRGIIDELAKKLFELRKQGGTGGSIIGFGDNLDL